jgi:hypothetical protein
MTNAKELRRVADIFAVGYAEHAATIRRGADALETLVRERDALRRQVEAGTDLRNHFLALRLPHENRGIESLCASLKGKPCSCGATDWNELHVNQFVRKFNDALAHPDAPCKTCGGSKWVRDTFAGSIGDRSYSKPCPDCSKGV